MFLPSTQEILTRRCVDKGVPQSAPEAPASGHAHRRRLILKLSTGLLLLCASPRIFAAPGSGVDSTQAARGTTARAWPAGQTLARLSQFGRQLGGEFLRGIVRANYRETPPGDIAALHLIPLPKPLLPATIGHPSLLFRERDWPRLRTRLHRPPYADWAAQILFEARSTTEDPSSPLLNEGERSGIAKVSAFAYRLTGEPRFRQTALQALRNMAEPARITTIEGGRRGIGWGDWLQAADALRQYAVAYDLLASTLSLADRAVIAQKLAAETELLAGVFALVPENNHTTIIAIGVGSAALALADASLPGRASPQRWLDVAMTQLSSGLAQIEPDGSYREGAYYARYIASRLFPFALYLYHVTGVNLLAQPRLVRFSRWLLDIEKPDGSVPDFDDAFPENFFYEPIAVGLSPNGGELRSSFERHGQRLRSFSSNLVEAFCGFDDRVQPGRPTQRSAAFYPDGGMAVFRSSRERQSIYGLLLAEPGRPHLSWHDHADPTAFTLTAFGHDLLIDAGYGPGGVTNPDRAWYVSPEAHNMPLVDGLGPDPNPVWGDQLGGRMADFFETDELAAAAVTTHYRGSDVQRRVWFVDHRYFVVADRLSAAEPKRFSVPWHGLGQFEPAGFNRVEWRQNDVRLEAEFVTASQAPVTISPQVGLHTLAAGGSHATAVVSLPAAPRQRLVTLLIPQAGGAPRVDVDPVPVSSKAAATGRRIRTVDAGGEDLLIVADGPWQSGLLDSDAEMALAHQGPSGAVAWISVVGATYLRIAGEKILDSDRPVNASLVLDERGWYGYLGSPEGEARVQLYPPVNPGLVMFNKKKTGSDPGDGSVLVAVRGSGPLEMGLVGGRVRTVERLRRSYPLLNWLGQSNQRQDLVRQFSTAQRLELRNEILAALGNAGIHWSDGVLQRGLHAGPQATRRLYGLTAGILNSLYDPSGLARMRLPQVLDIQQSWGDRDVRFYQEGLLTETGLQVRRQRMTVVGQDGSRLRVQHQRLFRGQESGSLEWERKRMVAFLRVEDWRGRRGFQVGLDRRSNSGWISLQHSVAAVDGSSSSLVAAGAGRWSSVLSVARPAKGSGWKGRLDLRKTSSRLASTLNLRFASRDGPEAMSLRTSWRPTPQVLVDNEWHTARRADQRWESGLNTRLFVRSANLSSVLSAQSRFGTDLLGTWMGLYHSKGWRIDGRGRFGSSLSGRVEWDTFGVARRSQNSSWQARLRRYGGGRATEAEIRLVRRAGTTWTSSLYASWQAPLGKPVAASLGVTHSGTASVGGEIGLERSPLTTLARVTGFVGLPLTPAQGLHLYVTSLLDSRGRLRGYEVILTQWGGEATPGLLLSRDGRGLLRFEGHVKLVW